jgi:hypothetical protein
VKPGNLQPWRILFYINISIFLGLNELQQQVVNNTETIELYLNSTLPEACINYEILDDARRHYSQDKSGNYLCDNDAAGLPYKNNWKGRNYYRIMAPAGTKIKEGCVAGDNACGTYGQGYITSGTHPTMVNERSTLTVCFKNGAVCPPSTCYKSIDIEVINCGSYYVYDLLSTDACAYAYCSE